MNLKVENGQEVYLTYGSVLSVGDEHVKELTKRQLSKYTTCPGLFVLATRTKFEQN
jgi:hypothetical protein